MQVGALPAASNSEQSLILGYEERKGKDGEDSYHSIV